MYSTNTNTYYPYNNMMYQNRNNIQYSNNDDRITGGFVFAFLLGGETAAALAPAFYRPYNNYYYQQPYYYYRPYPYYWR